MNFVQLVAVLVVVAVIGAGLSRARYPRAPFVVAGVVIAIYAIGMTTTGIWSATCWDCRSDTGESRSDVFYTILLLSSLAAGLLLLGVWLGARMATMLGRLHRTWDELRGRKQPKNVDAR